MFWMLGCCIKHNQYIYGNFVKLGDWGWGRADDGALIPGVLSSYKNRNLCICLVVRLRHYKEARRRVDSLPREMAQLPVVHCSISVLASDR